MSEQTNLGDFENHDELATDGGARVVDPTDPPANESVKLIVGITRLTHAPKIIDAETSSTGKTIRVEPESNSYDKSAQLESDEIFAGETEFRGSLYFELYTKERLRSAQRANKAPGPRAGANEVSDPADLPEPTHELASETEKIDA